MDMEGEVRYCHECGTDLTAGPRLKLIIACLLAALMASTIILGYNLSVWRKSSLELEAWNMELTAQLQELKARVDELSRSVSKIQEESSQLRSQLAETKAELDRYQLRRPTMDELRAFLAEDDTNEHRYDEEDYPCTYYARDLRLRAAQHGYNLCFIVVNYRMMWRGEYGHALNGAYLSDGTFIYIEPQNDKIYRELMEDLKEMADTPYIEIINYSIIW
jgi:predicted RNase H-like nuclease (RuvC/YqgF family)